MKMTVPPEFEAGELKIHPYIAATTEHLSWMRDQRVTQYSEQRHICHTIDSLEAYVSNAWQHGWMLGIHHPAIGHIGNMTVLIDPNNSYADLAIIIGRLPGYGYGAQAWQAVSDYLLKSGIRKLEAGCMEPNMAMRRVAEKTGMTLEGIRPGHFLFEGKPVAMLMYARYR